MEKMINYYSMTNVKLKEYENEEDVRTGTGEPKKEEIKPVSEEKTNIAEYLTATYLG